MYTQQELDSLDRKYFAVILANEHDITLLSKNTHHMWQLHSVELPDGQLFSGIHDRRGNHGQEPDDQRRQKRIVAH